MNSLLITADQMLSVQIVGFVLQDNTFRGNAVAHPTLAVLHVLLEPIHQ